MALLAPIFLSGLGSAAYLSGGQDEVTLGDLLGESLQSALPLPAPDAADTPTVEGDHMTSLAPFAPVDGCTVDEQDVEGWGEESQARF